MSTQLLSEKDLAMAVNSARAAHCSLCDEAFDVDQLIDLAGYPACRSCVEKAVKQAEIDKPRFYKINEGKEIAGVLGGLADAANMERDTFRFLVVLLVIFTGIVPGLIAYFVLAFLLPVYDG